MAAHAAGVIWCTSLLLAACYYGSTVFQGSIYYSYAFNIEGSKSARVGSIVGGEGGRWGVNPLAPLIAAVGIFGFQNVAASAAIAYSIGAAALPSPFPLLEDENAHC